MLKPSALLAVFVLFAAPPAPAATMPYSTGELVNIGGSGAQFAVTYNGTIYGLTTGRTQIWKYTGDYNWTCVYNGTAQDGILAGGNSTTQMLFRYVRSSGIWKYDNSGTSWTQVGYAGDQFALYYWQYLVGLTSDQSQVWLWNGSGTSWTQIGNAASQLFGKPWQTYFYARSPYSPYNVWRFNSAGNWTELSGSGSYTRVDANAFADSYPYCWGTNASGHDPYEAYDYSDWEDVSNSASGYDSDMVMSYYLGSGNGSLSARDSSSGLMYRYTVSSGTWQQETEFPVTDVVTAYSSYKTVVYHNEDDGEPYLLTW